MTLVRTANYQTGVATGGDAADSTSGASIAVNTTAALRGTYGVDLPGLSNEYHIFDLPAGVDTLYVSAYFKIRTLPAGARRVIQITDTGGTTLCSINISFTGSNIIARTVDGAATNVGGTLTLATGVNDIIRLCCRYTKGTGANSILEGYYALGDAAYTTAFASTTNLTKTTQAQHARIGNTTASTVDLAFDRVQINDAALPSVANTLTASYTGTVTSAGAATKAITYHTLTGGVASAGVAVRAAAKSFSGSVASAGALVRTTGKQLAGVVASSGSITARSIAQHLSGAVASSGTASKLVLRSAFSGAVASAGALSRTITLHTLTGAVAASGTLVRGIGKALAGSVASSGVLERMLGRLFTGSVASSGAIKRSAATSPRGTVASSGTLARAFGKTFSGTVASAGTLARSTARHLSGVVTSAGALTSVRMRFLSVAGTVASSGTLKRGISTSFAGTVASTGSVGKRIGKLLAGVVAAVGSLLVKPKDHPGTATLTLTAVGSATLDLSVVEPPDFTLERIGSAALVLTG